ncbi:MAG: transcriptional regulator [Acidianus infernus]|uniref:transcriptional regulator n=1 Tax=Acidianus infernus TaxID=12915 RepID=UPI002274A34A|nr:transcriptional regulator [Acidianus infernus]MCY0883919.1 transcriptional regulator [Acidianus infernus]
MNRKVIAPCEVAVRDIIPVIKAILVERLYAQGLSQLQISTLMGISPAEVNYYLKGKRGNEGVKKKLEADEEIMDLVNSVVRRLVNSTNGEVINICPLCSLARKN